MNNMHPNAPNQGLPYPAPPQPAYTPPGTKTRAVRIAAWTLVIVAPLLVVGAVAVLGTTHLSGIHIILIALVGLFGLNGLIGGIRMIRTGQRSKVTLGIALALFAALLGVALQTGSSDEDGDHGKPDMSRMAEKIGRGLPRMIDSETRWDSVMAGPPDTLTYNYTMVHFTANELDGESLATFMANSKKKICALPDMQKMLKTGSVMEFKWRGKDGRAITELRVTEETCR